MYSRAVSNFVSILVTWRKAVSIAQTHHALSKAMSAAYSQGELTPGELVAKQTAGVAA